MKKKILNQNLIKSLIHSDFLLLDKKILNNTQKLNFRFVNNNFSINKTQNILRLDILETIKDLKQFIRMIYFIKKHSNLKKEIHFFIDKETSYPESLINDFLILQLSNQNILFDINPHNLNTSINIKKAINLGISLDDSIFDQLNKNFFKNQFNKNAFLFFFINSEIKSNLVTYKLFNNIQNYKKMLFFLGLLRQIILK